MFFVFVVDVRVPWEYNKLPLCSEVPFGGGFEWKEGYQMESFVCPTLETLFITSSEEDVNFTIQEFTNDIIGKNNSSS